MNLLHFNCSKPPTCFGRLLWPSSGRCFYEGYITKTSKPMYKMFTLVCFYSHSAASVHGHKIFKIDDNIHGVIQKDLNL